MTENPIEHQREALRDRCNDAVGASGNNVLSEVLSYFPEQAELFIKTQEYASKIEGRKDLWYIVQHKEGDQAGQIEHLGISGFTGEALFKIIGQIEQLRGETEYPKYFGDIEIIDKIIKMDSVPTTDTLTVWGLIDKKILEVMNVTDEEIKLLSDYSQTYHSSEKLNNMANDLIRRARSLKSKASNLVKNSVDKIEQVYPRKSNQKSEK